ncbi:Uncharacterised protein [Mycobacterium tuberculosis]|uniref:Uncharacterized protein n=1 Tax=Mycobacterium tuberculosis TaxID=1773 RepID=A0A655JTN2_MYCTX|nr:Uncharacterised protein [Mycobacterium tuberculosis]COZ58005.1 Uncharacterised protein [Mycobacterium tuberculosis]
MASTRSAAAAAVRRAAITSQGLSRSDNEITA